MIHAIKIQPPYFDDVISGKKTFEIRLNDREYQEGDYLALNEWEQTSSVGGHHTGRSCIVYVDYIENPKENGDRLCNGINLYCTNAAELIERLSAENERLSTLAELGNKRADDYRVMRDRALKAEKDVERLKKDTADIDEFARNICKERLLQGKAIADFDSLCRYIKTQKAEAYKEFAERLKRRFLNKNEIINNTIDNLLKELVGGDNA